MAHANTYGYCNASNNSELLGLSNLTLQPYESNLDSKENLEEMYHILLLQVNSSNGLEEKKFNSRLAAVCYQLGRIYYDIEDNSAMAESMFLKAKNIVRDHESEADNIISVINSLNMLGYIKIKDNENYEEALQYLLAAQHVFQEYNEQRWGSATAVSKLLPNFPIKRALFTNKNPLISSRLFTLFYIIEVYKHRGNTTDALLSTHLTLKIQLENNIFLQNPLDWALSSALIANLLCQQNAYKQARHHLAAASTFMEKIIPRQYVNLFNSETYKQYSADISRCWTKYGLRLLKKSKTRLMKQKTHRQPSEIFNNLLFKNFNMWHEEQVTQYYVNHFEDAESLANNILVNLNRTKKYYTFEKTANYYSDLCMDTCLTYKLLSNFQDNPDKMGKLLKKGIVDLELTANRLNEENCMNICRRIWYELGTVYSDIMDIKYERHVKNKLVLTDNAIKKINRYSSSSIKYYLRFIESFYVQRKLPEHICDPYVKPVLLAHLHMARCNNKKIVNQKNAKLEILFQCKKYYQTVVDYCERNPSLESMIPVELNTCRELLLSTPSRVDQLLKTQGPVKYYV